MREKLSTRRELLAREVLPRHQEPPDRNSFSETAATGDVVAEIDGASLLHRQASNDQPWPILFRDPMPQNEIADAFPIGEAPNIQNVFGGQGVAIELFGGFGAHAVLMMLASPEIHALMR